MVKNFLQYRRAGLISGSGKSPAEGNGYPLQYSCLGNPMDWRAWWATVHGGAKELDKTYRQNNKSNRSDLNSWVGNYLKDNMKSLQCWEYVFSREDDILHVISFSSVQSLSRVRLFATRWIAARQASVHHQLLELTQTHVHRVGDAIQSSHPLSSPSPPAPNPSQHQSLFQWVNSSHEVAKVLEFQL